jgi:hypothetical protein
MAPTSSSGTDNPLQKLEDQFNFQLPNWLTAIITIFLVIGALSAALERSFSRRGNGADCMT